MSEIYDKALAKLDKEYAEFKGNKYASAMRNDVLKTLINFCNQDEEFAQAVVQNDKTFSDCMAEVGKGIGTSISDLEAYKKAVQFYFPGADIKCVMTIDLIGDAAVKPIEMISSEPQKKSLLEMSLDDLF